MSWAGLTSMGYGTLVITNQTEVIFAAAVAMIQMVRAAAGALRTRCMAWRSKTT